MQLSELQMAVIAHKVAFPEKWIADAVANGYVSEVYRISFEYMAEYLAAKDAPDYQTAAQRYAAERQKIG